MRRHLLIVPLFFLAASPKAQVCTTPGQTPITAIYVCGSETFTHFTQEFCGQTSVPVGCSGSFSYTNKNPTYFRFACYTSGTLGFIITPHDLAVDFNWQLFDITSTNPVDIFTNPSLFIAGNWSSEPGPTGASDDGTNLLVCAGPTMNTFSKMPSIVAGRSYILMLSNESAATGPFNLLFTGGTATITDPVEPRLRDAATNCDRTQVRVRMNKSLLCSSIALDGSDFSIPGATIVAAVPWDCSSVFGTELVTLTLSQPLAPGTHQLSVKVGIDGNTMIDMCNRTIPAGDQISFNASNGIPTPMNDISFEVCSPGYIELNFSKNILCSSLAADGSDFLISGPQPLNVTIAPCFGSSNTIRLNLPAAFVSGDYQITLVRGTDGNTIIDECGIETPAGARLNFKLANSVSADFTRAGNISCGQTRIQFLHDGANQVSSWNWSFAPGLSSAAQNPSVQFSPGNYNVRLIVSNGECSDTSEQQFSISTGLKANFLAPDAICEGDTLHIDNITEGSADSWLWDYGNGMTSTAAIPPAPAYLSAGTESYYTIKMIATNTADACSDTVKKTVRVIRGCSFEVPSAFTPNGDGRNDLFGPVNALRAGNMNFRVYNRFGQLLFHSRSWNQRWDGRLNGLLQETGIYIWLFEYTAAQGNRIIRKGTVLLLR